MVDSPTGETFIANQFKYTLVRSGTAYFTLLKQMIVHAEKEILLHYYIWEDDSTGKDIIQHIIQAVDRGVDVKILLDGYGSRSLMDSIAIKQLIEKGAEVHFFNPIYHNLKIVLGRRLHQKVALVDSNKILLGGINISDRYSGIGVEHPWLDYAIFLEGDIALQLRIWMEDIWQKKFIKSIGRKLSRIRRRHFRSSFDQKVKLMLNDNFRGINQISNEYKIALTKSKDEIVIMASYFLPGIGLRRRLKKASERGARVIVILSGFSDVKLFKRASNYLYDWMIRNQITIYEYLPAVVHAKVAVVDGRWCTLGSYNLNHLSEYMSIEANVAIENQDFCKIIRDELWERINNDSKLIEPAMYHTDKKLLGRILDLISYQLITIGMKLYYLIGVEEVAFKSYQAKKQQ